MSEDTSCLLDLDEHHRLIMTELPRGHAWPREEDTTLWQYWRSFATVIKYLEDRICAFTDELFCEAANETLPTWLEQYGLPDDCDQSGATLCARVAAQGGASEEYFESLIARLGYSGSVRSLASNPPKAGGLMCGCTSLWPSPRARGGGSNLGCMAAGYCPPAYGSPLGQSQLGDGCCNLAGYREPSVVAAEDVQYGACGPTPPLPPIPGLVCGSMFAGHVEPVEVLPYYGNEFTLLIKIDTEGTGNVSRECITPIQAGGIYAAGGNPLGVSVITGSPVAGSGISMAGQFYAGDTELCRIKFEEAFCLLERVKPAHINLAYAYV